MSDQPLNLLQRFLYLGNRHPVFVVLTVLAISLAATLGLPGVSTETGTTHWLDQDSNAHQSYLHIAREFGSDRRSYVYLHDEHAWTPEKLQVLENLHNALRQLPFVERVDDLFSSPIVLSEEGQLHSQPLLAGVPVDQQAADRARRMALEDPVALRNIVSGDGKSIAIGLMLREGLGGLSGADAHDVVAQIIAPARQVFARVEQIGMLRNAHDGQVSLMTDLKSVLPMAALLLGLSLYTLFRSKFAAFMPLLVASLATLWALGLAGYAGIPVSALFLLLPPVAAVLATLKIIRLYSSYPHEQTRNHDAASRPDRVRMADFMVRQLGLPILLTVVIMASGFALHVLSPVRILRDFGLAATLALSCAGFLTLFLLPALMTLFGVSRQPSFNTPLDPLPAALVRRLRTWNPRYVLGLAALTGIFLTFLLARLAPPGIHWGPDSAFSLNHPAMQASQTLHQEIAGAEVFYITLDTHATEAFRDPVNLKRLAEIQAFIGKQQVFDRSLSLADLVSQTSMAVAGGRPDAYQVPTSRKLVAQYLLAHPRNQLEHYVSHDWRRTTIVVRHAIGNAALLNHHVHELREAAAGYAGPSMSVSVSSENLLINRSGAKMAVEQGGASLLMLLVIFALMSLMYTSLKGGFIALIPVLIPIVGVIGAMWLLGIPLSATSFAVVVLICGLSLEGTLSLFARYSEQCRQADSFEEAVSSSITQEATPMLAQWLVFSLLFASLMTAETAFIAQFGFLACLAILCMVVANLLIIPLAMARIRLVGIYEMLSLSNQQAALDCSPLFQGMSRYEIRKTILISELRDYPAGARLIEQGSVGRSMFLVVSGALEVVRRDSDGERRQATLEPGDVFGEIGFVNQTYRIADVRALEPVSVLRFDHERLKKDLMLFPHIMAKLNFNICGILGGRLSELVESQSG